MRGTGRALAVAAALAYVALVAPTIRGAALPKAAIIVAGGATSRLTLPCPVRDVYAAGPLGATVVEVEGRRVRVKTSPCPNKCCVRRGWLAAPGETAVCLPNRVAVRLE